MTVKKATYLNKKYCRLSSLSILCTHTFVFSLYGRYICTHLGKEIVKKNIFQMLIMLLFCHYVLTFHLNMIKIKAKD